MNSAIYSVAGGCLEWRAKFHLCRWSGGFKISISGAALVRKRILNPALTFNPNLGLIPRLGMTPGKGGTLPSRSESKLEPWWKVMILEKS